MGAFGWSLPPGCGAVPGEEEPYLFPEQETVSELLEGAGIDWDSEAGQKVDEIVHHLCRELADLREALSCAARLRLVVRFEASEVSTTSGFAVDMPSTEREAVSTAFVQLMRHVSDE